MQRAPLIFVSLAAVVSLCGCRQIFGIEEREAGKTTAEVPGTSFYTAACLTCLESECGPELSLCLDDEVCHTTFDSVRSCVDPGCWFAAIAPFGGWSGYPLNKKSPTSTLTLDECSSTVCSDACRVGQNFDCAGSYGWRRIRDSGPFEMEVGTVWNSNPVVGALVSTCGPLGCAAQKLATQSSDLNGLVLFTIAGDEVGWFGSLAFDPQVSTQLPGMLAFDHYRSYPFFDFESGLVNNVTIEAEWSALGGQYDPERAYLIVKLQDCHLFEAPRGLYSLGVSSADDQTLIHQNAIPGPFQFFAIVARLPAETPATLIVTDDETGTELVTFDVLPRKGAVTYIELTPPTKAQAAPQ